MSIAEKLDDIRGSVAGCRLAAFADLSSRLVLRVSADRSPRQETLATLATAARMTLVSDLSQGAAEALGVKTGLDTAFVLTPDHVRAFVCAAPGSSDAVLMEGEKGTDLQALAQAGHALLDAEKGTS